MDSTLNMAPGLNPGDTLMHFQVQEQLASGGQGIVWRAYDSLLDRSVAIKQIAEGDVVDEAMRQKFRAEGDLQKKVSTSSSHVVDVIDLVDDHRGLFIVMEYVEGQSLDRLLSTTNGPVDALTALKVIRDAALGLAAIHKAGIIHRDLKPGNILLPADGSPAKICDFGLARLLEDQDTMSTGTVAYMAPELFGGEGADGRADIYALGMVAYEMVAGRPAFEQAFRAVLRDQRNQAMRWMKWHTNVRVTAPPLKELNEKAPARLTELIDRMMAKDPGQRIASAGQLVEAIARHFGKGAKQEQAAGAPGSPGAPAAVGAPSSGGSPMAAMPTAALGKKKKWPIVVAALVVFWTIVLGGIAFYQDYRASSELAAQEEEGRDAYTEAREAYQAEDWPLAEERFAAVAERFPDHPLLGAVSEVVVVIAQGHQSAEKAKTLMSEGQFDAARKLCVDTIDTLDEAHDLVDAAQADRRKTLYDDLKRLKDNLKVRAAFAQKAGEIDALIKQGKTQEGRIAYEMLKKTAPALIAAEQQKMADIYGTLQGLAQQDAINRAKDEATVEFANQNYAKGIRVLEEAIARYGNHPALVDTLASVNLDRNYKGFIAQGDAALNENDHAGALTAYTQAHQLKPSPELKSKISSVRLAKGLKEARAALDADNVTEASAVLNVLVGEFPDNTEVQTLLKGIATGKSFANLVASGDSALAAKKWVEAIGNYTQALNIKPDAEVQTKLTQARIGKTWDEAKAAGNARNLDEAERLANAVLAMDAGHTGATRLLEQIKVQRRLGSDVKRAADLRAKGDYRGSKKILRELLEYAENLGLPESFLTSVRDQLKAVELDHLVQQVEGAMETKNITLARATLETAFSFAKRNNVVDKRLVELERKLSELEKQFG